MDRNAKYLEYVSLLKDVSEDKKAISKKQNQLNKLGNEIKDSGMLATKVSDHAMSQAADRLEELAYKSELAYNDIFKGRTEESLFLASNLRGFILSGVCKSIEDGTFKSKKARSGGVEYIYNIHIPEWNSDSKELMFTIIVENSNVKTVYFNLVDRK